MNNQETLCRGETSATWAITEHRAATGAVAFPRLPLLVARATGGRSDSAIRRRSAGLSMRASSGKRLGSSMRPVPERGGYHGEWIEPMQPNALHTQIAAPGAVKPWFRARHWGRITVLLFTRHNGAIH